jgi:hypothetical protein
MSIKTKSLSSEKNGISIAVNVGTDKPVYASPAQLMGLLANADSIRAELASCDSAELTAINERAASTPEARKLARVTAQRTKLQEAVTSAKTDGEKEVAELSLKLFELQNKA